MQTSCFKTEGLKQICSALSIAIKFQEWNKMSSKKKEQNKKRKNFYPTAIIRAKKNDHVVAIPPKR
jgi:hypothetical protein